MRKTVSSMPSRVKHLVNLAIIIISTTVCSNAQTWIPKGNIPANAVAGGSENTLVLYVCRARYEGSLHPGKIVSGNCNIGWGGREISLSNYEILIGSGTWAVPRPGFAGAFIGGFEGGQPLYLCRARFNGVHPGKVVGTNCNIGYGGEEKVLSVFDVFYPAPVSTRLSGYIDMHTHPMSQFGFGREFFFGNIDGDPNGGLRDCNCMHGFVAPIGPFRPTGSCGQQNAIRNALIDFIDPHPKRAGDGGWDDGWPKQSYTTHQQMWWEWLDRARRGGLKTIVALAQNSHAIADALETRGPYDDLRSMNDQIRELVSFAQRHRDIMEIVTDAARMRRVVGSGKLAIIIGIEMDNIGNFYSPAERREGETYNSNPTETNVRTEIDRLFDLGVRYVFPVHIVNNVFGGAAIYGEGPEPFLFNLSNLYDTGRRFDVERVPTNSTGIAFKEPENIDLGGSGTLISILRHSPFSPLPSGLLNLSQYSYPNPGEGFGHRNTLGLSELGKLAIRHMMRKGMMIDIDHMSERSISDALTIAMENDYPLDSGHNGPRGAAGNEKARTDGQYEALRLLGGMIGVGTGSAEASGFLTTYRTVLAKMGARNVAIGTDVHVGAKLPGPPSTAARLSTDVPGLEVCCRTGSSTTRWNFESYNSFGVSHYGLMPEFIQSLQNVGMTGDERNALFSSAEYFARMC